MTGRTILFSALMAALLLPLGRSDKAYAQKAPPMPTLYVSTKGNDNWSGLPEKAIRSMTDGLRAIDGPLASLSGARDAIRRLRAAGNLVGPVTVLIEPGTYTLDHPFVLEPQDSGGDAAPVTYRGLAGDRPVLSGGRVLTGFHKEGKLWTLSLPEVASGNWSFESLWVNGQRRTPARTPNDGYFYTVGPASPVLNPATGKMDPQDTIAFRFKPGDIQAWEHPEDIKVVVLHNWETSTLRIKSVDLQNHVVTFTGPAQWPFTSHQRYFIRNAPDALDQPGEWRLDGHSGVLSYMPLPGETLATTKIVAPVLQQLILLGGDPANGHYVDNVHFRDLQFSHTNYPIEPGGHGDGQAAASVHATFQATGARNCSVEGCAIAHTGNYGIWWRTGCDRDRTEGNELYDLGAGGVRIGEGGDPKTPGEAVGNCLVSNNYIHDNGTIFSGACGVWIGRSSGNTISHNDIGDQDYTGVSVGWSWGYAASSANNNIIEYNHIHDLGRGVLSDMGTIYSLGVSPGTIERGNVMHDVYCYPGGYGGWGVYTDEGSSNILVENNLVYNCASGPFHQHYGQDNILRNNIFAYGITAILRRTREEDHNSFTFEHNIVASNGTPFMEAGWKNGHYTIDNNLYWDYSTPDPQFFGMSLADWQKAGHDVHSVLADPLFFRHPVEGQETFTGATPVDFHLKTGSPALKLGFVPFSMETAGLIGNPAWRSLPSRTPHKRYVPVQLLPEPIHEDFENTPVGMRADAAVSNVEGKGDSILVTDETAAGGKHSLKFVDAPGLTNIFDPHFFYAVNWSRGMLQEDLDIRVEAGAIVNHEWRDWRGEPYRTGPNFTIDAAGHMTAGGTAIADLPLGQWVHVTLTGNLGTAAAGHFDLSIKLPEEARPLVFHNLPCSPLFHSLTWIGFSMNADQHAVMYLDNLELRPAG